MTRNIGSRVKAHEKGGVTAVGVERSRAARPDAPSSAHSVTAGECPSSLRYIEVDASDDSRPILERLGFDAVTTTTPYVWSPGPATDS
jgi:hypothetical protein